MTEKLNPSEAQRKAMIQAAIDHSGMGSIRATEVVDAQITAADSIPEGAPVGTIARRPDGAWIAHRYANLKGEGRWNYFRVDYNAPFRSPGDADSWPVIYDPTKPEGCGHPNHGNEDHDCKPFLPDPTAQQEPAASIDASHLERQREFSLKTFGPGARTNGVLDHIAKELNEIREAPEDISEWVDVIILAFDGAWRAGWEPQQIIDAIVAKQSKNELREWPDWRTADPDKAIEHVRGTTEDALRPDDVKLLETDPLEFVRRTRQPRVVDRLGVDEQGSRWRGRRGSVYQQDTGGWRTDDGRLWRSPYKPWTDAPYTEILEPRVLLTLDCEEARDGTVWRETAEAPDGRYGWSYRFYESEWQLRVSRGGAWRPIGHNLHRYLCDLGPYTEVLGDPS